MTQYRFGKTALAWFGGVLVFSMGLIFVSMALGDVESCKRGVCSALVYFALLAVRPIGIVICLIGLGWAIARRIRSLGLGAGWTIAVALWLLSTIGFWIFPPSIWHGIHNNLGGFFRVMGHTHLLFAFGFVTFLWLSDHRVSLAAPNSRYLWICAGIAAGHSILVSLPFLLVWPIGMLGLGSLILKPVRFIASIASLGLQPFIWLWIDLAVFLSALSWLLLQSRNYDDSEAQSPPPASPLGPATGIALRRSNGPVRPQGFGRRSSG